jgi:hypothetical protein
MFLGSQFAGIGGKLTQIFHRKARVKNAIDVEENAVRAAEEVARLFGERKRRSDFGNHLTYGGEIYCFGIQQLPN